MDEISPVVDQRPGFFLYRGHITIMLDSVMVNISHFDCDVLSSNLSPATTMADSLTG